MIEQTIRAKLPDGFQTAGFLMEHGMLDLVEPRENLPRTIRSLARAARRDRGARGADRASLASRLPETDGEEPVEEAEALVARDPWEVVQLARNLERPHTLDYVGFVFDDFLELHGDRAFRDDPAIVAGAGAAR